MFMPHHAFKQQQILLVTQSRGIERRFEIGNLGHFNGQLGSVKHVLDIRLESPRLQVYS